jgi:hypothetical protein
MLHTHVTKRNKYASPNKALHIELLPGYDQIKALKQHIFVTQRFRNDQW